MPYATQPLNPGRPDDPWRWGRWLREQLSSAEDCGYFGPRSAIWSIHREAVLSVGLIRALLLQLAHPWVAQAVADHSTFQENPLDRLAATVAAAELLVFGSKSQADATAAGILRVHDRIVGTLNEDTGIWRAGTPYRAHDPAALLWVLATLMDTTLAVYEASFGRLDDETVRAYLRDTARIGMMLGVPMAAVPRDRQALNRYMQDMMSSGQVAVSTIALDLGRQLMRPNLMGTARFATWPYRTAARGIAALMMPDPLRAQYAPILGLRGVVAYRLSGRACRLFLPWLPPRVRYDPIASTALERAPSQGV